MKKRIFLILTFAVLLFPGFSATNEIEHPATYNLDLSKYTNVLDLTAEKGQNIFSGIIKGIKFKKNIPEAGDKIVIYCTAKTSVNMQSLKGELYSNKQSYGTFELRNQEEKKNKRQDRESPEINRKNQVSEKKGGKRISRRKQKRHPCFFISLVKKD